MFDVQQILCWSVVKGHSVCTSKLGGADADGDAEEEEEEEEERRGDSRSELNNRYSRQTGLNNVQQANCEACIKQRRGRRRDNNWVREAR